MAKKSDNRKRRFLKYFLGITLILFFVCILALILKVFANYESNKESQKLINMSIAEQLNKKPDELNYNDYQKIKTLYISGYKITNIKLIKKCKNLESLSLSYIRCTNLKPLAKLTKLKTLKICFLSSPDRTESKLMRKLREILRLREQKRKEVAISLKPINKLVNLEELVLRATKFKYFNVIHGFKNLKELEITDTISDLKNLLGITSLETLKIHEKQISDINPIKSLVNLNSLYISGMPINDANEFVDFTHLTSLHLYDIDIKDINALLKLPELKSLSLRNLPVDNLSILSRFENLESLSLQNMKISDISPILKLQNLDTLVLSFLNINDIRLLTNLKNLKHLRFIQESIDQEHIDELKQALPNLEVIIKLSYADIDSPF